MWGVWMHLPSDLCSVRFWNAMMRNTHEAVHNMVRMLACRLIYGMQAIDMSRRSQLSRTDAAWQHYCPGNGLLPAGARCPRLQAAVQQQHICAAPPSALLMPLLLCAAPCPSTTLCRRCRSSQCSRLCCRCHCSRASGRPPQASPCRAFRLGRHGRAHHLVHGLDDLLRLDDRRRLQLKCVRSRHILGTQPDDLRHGAAMSGVPCGLQQAGSARNVTLNPCS